MRAALKSGWGWGVRIAAVEGLVAGRSATPRGTDEASVPTQPWTAEGGCPHIVLLLRELPAGGIVGEIAFGPGQDYDALRGKERRSG